MRSPAPQSQRERHLATPRTLIGTKPHRGDICGTGPQDTAPMGLKNVYCGRCDYKYAVPTELAFSP